jgi:hypothetical protein
LAACTFKPVTPIQLVPEVVATEKFEQVINNSADILLVVDNSGSMAEEQFNLMANIAKFVEILGDTGAELRFAAITTDGPINPQGNFFTNPGPTVAVGGQLLRSIPQAFCDGVITNSANGVLSPDNIQDFTGRATGFFQDANGDRIADNQVVAEFADGVGCLLAAGIVGNGSEVALCQAAAALDAASLAGNNSGFLTNPDSILAIVFLGDEDDCADEAIEQGGDLICEPVTLNSNSGSLKCSVSGPICDFNDQGQFANLVAVQQFADRIKGVRPEEKIFIATISGPPGPIIPDCDLKLPVPSCFNEGSGSASPGNRLFEFAQLFPNRIDALAAPICGNFGDIIAQIGADLGQLLNAGCLNAQIDPANFDPATDMIVRFDITNAVDVAACSDIVDINGQQVTTADPANANLCVADPAFLNVEANAACVETGLQVSFVGFTPPTNSEVTITYLAVAQ